MTSLLRIVAAFSAAALVLLGTAGRARAASSKGGYGELTIDEVQQLVAAKAADVFDNNSQERWAQSHVPGAKWVAFNDVKASDLPQDKDRKLVFYCASRL